MNQSSRHRARLWNAGGWRDRAACRGMDADLFFPHGETAQTAALQTGEAKAVCRRCPVRLHCLTYALATHPQDGIWGGLNLGERARLRRRRLHRRVAASQRTRAWCYSSTGSDGAAPTAV